jgi:hypothetical protein
VIGAELQPWNLAVRALVDDARLPVVREAAHAFRPDLGSMPAAAGAELRSAVHDALDDLAVVGVHSSEPGWVPSMVNDGFEWPRWRDTDGFEPYEDKLAEWNVLGTGERSEQLLFAGLSFLPAHLPLDAAIAARAATRPAPEWTSTVSAAANDLTTGYGPVSLVFGTDALLGATMIPHVSSVSRIGLHAGTAEHLADTIASRIALDHGFMSDRLVASLRAAGRDADAARFDHMSSERHSLLRMLEQPHERVVGDVRTLLLDSGLQSPPMEAHLRRPMPEQLVGLHAERPAVDEFSSVMAAGPRMVTTKFRTLRNVIDPESLHAIEDAGAGRGLPLINGPVHHDAIAAAADVANPRPPTVRYAKRFSQTTALATAQLRPRFRAAEADAAAPG